MFPQACISAGKASLHLYAVRLGLTTISQSPAGASLGVFSAVVWNFGSGCNLNKV